MVPFCLCQMNERGTQFLQEKNSGKSLRRHRGAEESKEHLPQMTLRNADLKKGNLSLLCFVGEAVYRSVLPCFKKIFSLHNQLLTFSPLFALLTLAKTGCIGILLQFACSCRIPVEGSKIPSL